MRGPRLRIYVAGIATAAALITGVWWWVAYRVQIVFGCIGYADRRPGAPICLPDPIDWTRRTVAVTFVVAVIVLMATVLVELIGRWRGVRATGSLRTQA